MHYYTFALPKLNSARLVVHYFCLLVQTNTSIESYGYPVFIAHVIFFENWSVGYGTTLFSISINQYLVHIVLRFSYCYWQFVSACSDGQWRDWSDLRMYAEIWFGCSSYSSLHCPHILEGTFSHGVLYSCNEWKLSTRWAITGKTFVVYANQALFCL